MCLNLLRDARLFALLLEIDLDLAAQVRQRGCPHCEGKLYTANYPRKPRGALGPLPEGYDLRASLCCGREGCRCRQTPPSVRFLGPKVYLGVVVVLVSALRHHHAISISQVCKALGVRASTVRRWRRFWLELFATSAFWRLSRGLLGATASQSAPPSCLLETFLGEALERLVNAMRFLSPISTRGGLAMHAI